jgi:uncharacterized protein
VLPLVASSVGTDQLLGGPGSRPAAVDALAARTLVKGEPLAAPAGRADDFIWPRREIAREPAKVDVPIAATTPTAPATAPVNPPPSTTAIAPDGSIITAPRPAQKRIFRPVQTQPQPQPQPWLRGFFGFGGFGAPQQRPLVTPPQRAPGPPRPPANIGRSAEVPPRNSVQ